MRLVDSDRPGKTEWDLHDRSLHLPTFFDRPLCIVDDDLLTICELDDGKSLISTSDMSDRAIRVSGFEVIFYEHHTSSGLEYQSLWCETSFLDRFDKRS